MKTCVAPRKSTPRACRVVSTTKCASGRPGRRTATCGSEVHDDSGSNAVPGDSGPPRALQRSSWASTEAVNGSTSDSVATTTMARTEATAASTAASSAVREASSLAPSTCGCCMARSSAASATALSSASMAAMRSMAVSATWKRCVTVGGHRNRRWLATASTSPLLSRRPASPAEAMTAALACASASSASKTKLLFVRCMKCRTWFTMDGASVALATTICTGASNLLRVSMSLSKRFPGAERSAAGSTASTSSTNTDATVGSTRSAATLHRRSLLLMRRSRIPS
mmetsp:Transcript_20547/g.63917  ORF Transcript_20547/g.63917 Transcript_20547/m.63917 type:complete len:284 (+) Transcript_20547:177-1028(+)